MSLASPGQWPGLSREGVLSRVGGMAHKYFMPLQALVMQLHGQGLPVTALGSSDPHSTQQLMGKSTQRLWGPPDQGT